MPSPGDRDSSLLSARMAPTFELHGVLKGADSLPSPPGIALELLRLTENDDATIEDITAAISCDPALTARILKVSNSAMYGVRREITTLNQACVMLGLKTVRLMSLSFSLAIALGGNHKGSFDYDQYWTRSLVCASSARALAARQLRAMSDEAFLAGLLSRIGQLVLAECASTEYMKVLKAAEGFWPTVELERSVLGCGSDEVGLALLESWGMPDLTRSIVESIRRDPDGGDEDVLRLIPIMRFAVACEELVCGHDKPNALDAVRLKGRAIGLEGEALDDFLLEIETQVIETAESFDVKLGDSLDMASILQQAQAQMLKASLSVAVQVQQAEARASQLESANRQLRTESKTDGLTGLANRACFDEALAECLNRRMARTIPGGLGLLMIDIDRFKQFNDTYGHLAGDEVMKAIAKTIESVCRESDLSARYGGEEFCVLMPSTTPAGVEALAGRVRKMIEETTVQFEGKLLRVTVSIGGAILHSVSSQPDGQELIRAADQRLYQAKQNGRNCWEV